MLWPRQNHPTGNPRSTATAQDRKDNSFLDRIPLQLKLHQRLELNARYRRAAPACGHFPNETAALKRLYLATLALDPTGRGRQRWNNCWKAALNEFDVLLDGRLAAGRV
ncbi:hypothetical protein ACFY1B_48055 [Streptomyces mirabilis]|uniref:hypothetical protein n=1 Tax=Streptomyces mirabilis TaxID=68239 RepID=UPI003677133F